MQIAGGPPGLVTVCSSRCVVAVVLAILGCLVNASAAIGATFSSQPPPPVGRSQEMVDALDGLVVGQRLDCWHPVHCVGRHGHAGRHRARASAHVPGGTGPDERDDEIADGGVGWLLVLCFIMNCPFV